MHVSQVVVDISKVFFAGALVSALLCEIYVSFGWLLYNWWQRLARFFVDITAGIIVITRDFVSITCPAWEIVADRLQKGRKYYIPWTRTPPVIIRSPDHMQVLSDSPGLSQRAVYADVTSSTTYLAAVGILSDIPIRSSVFSTP